MTAEVAAWRERVPRLVAECAARWELSVGAPLTAGGFSFVARAVRADGMPAVLKVAFPDPESEHEAAALAHWDGAGAVRLLAADAERRALLLERCVPGRQLWAVGDEAEADIAAAAVLRRLWRPAPERHDFRALEGEARRWAAELPARYERHGRPFDRALLDRAVAWIGELLAAPDGDPVVVHQDLHGGNVLLAVRGPWLAIDPKPLVGERAFDVASRCATAVRSSRATWLRSAGCGGAWTGSPASWRSTASGCAAGRSSTRLRGGWRTTSGSPTSSRAPCGSTPHEAWCVGYRHSFPPLAPSITDLAVPRVGAAIH